MAGGELVVPEYLTGLLATGEWLGIPGEIVYIPDSEFVLIQPSRHFFRNPSNFVFHLASKSWQAANHIWAGDRQHQQQQHHQQQQQHHQQQDKAYQQSERPLAQTSSGPWPRTTMRQHQWPAAVGPNQTRPQLLGHRQPGAEQQGVRLQLRSEQQGLQRQNGADHAGTQQRQLRPHLATAARQPCPPTGQPAPFPHQREGIARQLWPTLPPVHLQQQSAAAENHAWQRQQRVAPTSQSSNGMEPVGETVTPKESQQLASAKPTRQLAAEAAGCPTLNPVDQQLSSTSASLSLNAVTLKKQTSYGREELLQTPAAAAVSPQLSSGVAACQQPSSAASGGPLLSSAAASSQQQSSAAAGGTQLFPTAAGGPQLSSTAGGGPQLSSTAAGGPQRSAAAAVSQQRSSAAAGRTMFRWEVFDTPPRKRRMSHNSNSSISAEDRASSADQQGAAWNENVGMRSSARSADDGEDHVAEVDKETEDSSAAPDWIIV